MRHRASGGGEALFFVDSSGQQDVRLVGGKTEVVRVRGYGGGATNNVFSGTTSFLEVGSEGSGGANELIFGASEAQLEVLSFGHYGFLFAGAASGVEVAPSTKSLIPRGASTAVEVSSDAGGGPIDGLAPTIEVMPMAQDAFHQGALSDVDVMPMAAIRVLSGAQAGVDVTSAAFGVVLDGAASDVGVSSQADVKVTGFSLAEVEVLAEAFMAVSFGGVADVFAEPLTGLNVRRTGDLVASVFVDAPSQGTVVDGNDRIVEVASSSGAMLYAGESATVEVSPQTLLNVVSLVESVPTIDAAPLGAGLLFDGATSEVEVSISVGGFIVARVGAPLFRIIELRPKRRTIEFSGDDRSLRMAGEFEKQPREVVDYDIDMREWFAVNRDGDAIRRVEQVIIDPPGELVLGSPSTPETVLMGEPPMKAKIWLSGGVDGGEYKVTVLIKTQIGRVEEIDFTVRVEDI